MVTWKHEDGVSQVHRDGGADEVAGRLQGDHRLEVWYRGVLAQPEQAPLCEHEARRYPQVEPQSRQQVSEQR